MFEIAPTVETLAPLVFVARAGEGLDIASLPGAELCNYRLSGYGKHPSVSEGIRAEQNASERYQNRISSGPFVTL